MNLKEYHPFNIRQMEKGLIILAVTLIIAAQCATPLKYQQDILIFLPEPQTLEKWRSVDHPQTFAGEELYEYMNGGAELYYSKGFKRLVAQEYSKGGNKTISLEIFEMEDASSAQSMYALKTGAKGIPLNLGNDALFEEYYLNFWKGYFLVTVTAYELDKESLQAMIAIASDVAERIEDLIQ